MVKRFVEVIVYINPQLVHTYMYIAAEAIAAI
jgi:hypothetical protein